MEVFELNLFDQFVITVIKTHLFLTAMLCTFFLCSVLIGKSAEFAFIRTRKDARERTTAETQPIDSQGEANVSATATDSGQSFKPAEPKPIDSQGEANVSATTTDSGQSFKPAEQKDGFQEFKH